MSYSIGGALISRLNLSNAWGLSPACAGIEAVGASVIQPESAVTLNIGSFVFYGQIAGCTESTGENGTVLSITAPDNRLKLMQDTVFALFNQEEILEDNPNTPGIDRFKRFNSVLPDDWDAQKKTRRDTPYTAREICQYLFAADTVKTRWTANYHARFDKPVYGIDANKGKKLGSVLQEICEKIGVLMTLGSSPYGLEFAVKGEGAVPAPNTTNSSERSDGFAIGPDTRVRIVGDRNLYQDLPITLEPDWSPVYQDFWFEPAWLKAVSEAFGITDAAELAATAREVTVRDYVDATGDESAADHGKWGEVSRMDIAAWTYINDIVFKAYRVPRDYTLNGIDLDSLDLRDGLIAAVKMDTDGNIAYRDNDYYPDTRAFCIAQGIPLSNFDLKSRDTLNISTLTSMRTHWQPVSAFNIDERNKVILFESPVFVDGGGTAALYLAPNAAVAGLSDDLKNLVVPNADALISPANVKASLCFEAETYSKWFGSGVRDTVEYVPGLCYHALLQDNTWTREIKLVSGKGADAVAAEAGNSALTGQNHLQSGGFQRNGSAGTALTGAIDRISVTLDENGICEQIDFSKERAPVHFESERELERRQKMPDAVRKLRELRDEATEIRFEAKYRKPMKRQSVQPLPTLHGAMETPPGACHPGNQTFSSDDTWPAGKAVFLDTGGVPSGDGKVFGGITTAHNATGPHIPTATQGIVPVRVTGPFTAGDSIGIDAGTSQECKVGGTQFIGVVNATYSGTETILAPVRLGGGAAGAQEDFSLYDAGGGQLGSTNGTVGGILPTGMTDGGQPAFKVAVTGAGLAYLAVTHNPDGTPAGVTFGTGALPADTTSTGHKILGDYNNVAGVISIGSGKHGLGSQNYRYCGGTSHYFWT